ncbi:DNA-directed RNA polymerase III complex subunit Rpc37 [Metarhizium album ARSEF 1941]|uniref:DNA-directed RNA polymerase III complex subunit Rpc37 n=1 Tax=Metarhizium album (strain ARSEF 1941) TaxID=1081103 RepID=A0A0B2WSE0_METAS|nr:DNA-directed RNA polymerase III complex subunit Rpc37 [Metarhizium album ARSEF 1941]KHN98991.1 DNA-directed RNA polymerase III complex subunit Rpc37 [Metarhizium album ARSEF 1941]
MSKFDEMDVDNDAEDDDPITASYPVFLNPALPLGRRLLILQQPNRTDDTPRPPPTELRLKAHSGMVEVDVPLDNTTAYDREKGLKWGRVLQSSMASKNGGSHGLAGGFGFGAVPQRGKKKGESDDDEYMDWNEAVRQDMVLRTQTLGGQYPDTDEVQYMVGVFQGKNLHLTPVSSLVHLRPQLHHLDAATQQERSASASASKEAAGSSSTAARAIHMTIKNTADGDAVTTETMADRLRFVQTENWRKMRYTDENEEAAWEVYNESLFLYPKAGGSKAAGESETKEKEPAETGMEELAPKLGAKWNTKQMLEAVSGIQKPDAKPEPEIKPEPKGKQAVGDRGTPKGKPRGGAAPAATKRTSRARAPSKTAITID